MLLSVLFIRYKQVVLLFTHSIATSKYRAFSTIDFCTSLSSIGYGAGGFYGVHMYSDMAVAMN
jgi:hypothetical protein